MTSPTLLGDKDDLPFEFEYEPLDRDTDSFRLLKLLPALDAFSGLIECLLYHSNITKEDGRYRALSYTWGPSQPKHRILLDGALFHVTGNLFQFLEMYKDVSSGIPTMSLWIDAICINQHNAREKSNQVQRMSQIYSAASEVTVY
jgi:hypothetical protein